MAYAFVQQNSADNAASATTITVTLTPTAGNLLVFCVSGDSLDTSSIALSDNLGSHNTFTQIGTDLVTANDQRCAWWHAANCKGGATTFTATFSAGTRFRTIYVAEYSGIVTTSPLLNGARAENANPGTGTDAVSSGVANATSQPALVWGFSIDTSGATTPNAGTGYTSRTGVWSTATCMGRPEDKRVTATGNVAATFTATTGTDDHATGVGIFSEVVTPIFDTDDCPPDAIQRPVFVPWIPIRVSADGEDAPSATVSAPNEDVSIVSVPRTLALDLLLSAVVADDLPTAAASTIVDDGIESIAQTAMPAASLAPPVTDEDFPAVAPAGGIFDDDSISSTIPTASQFSVPMRDWADGDFLVAIGSILDEESTPSVVPGTLSSLAQPRDTSDGDLPVIVGSIVDDSVDAVMRLNAAAVLPTRPSAGDEFAQFSPPAAPSTIFPLKISTSGRYLEQVDGTPFLLCADTTWSLFVDIPLSGVSSYFSTLISQGFNAVSGNAIEHHYTTVKPPKERGGLLPFTQKMDGTSYTGSPNGTTGAAGTQGQFASDNYSNINNQSPDPTFINNAYWLVVEQILDAALANNLAVLVWPGYLGFHSDDEGWLNEMVVWDAAIGAGGFTGQPWADNSKSKMWNYGAWMAARWKNYPHIIWVMGGDYGSNSQTLNTAQAAAVSNLMAGLKSVAGQQSLLFSAHWDRPALSTDTTLAAGTFDLNGCYADEAVAELARRGFASSPTKPTIGLEYFYENDLFGGSAPYRKYVYWQFLGGVAGGFYGEEQIWRFDDGTPGTDWTTLLATQARLDAARQFAFWKSLPWHRLKPSGLGGMGTIVTAGGGTASPQSTDYVAAAATADGDLLLAYVPPAHAGTITVDMTKMVTAARARWFDPTNATFTAIGTIANTGTHVFTTPATNSAGDTDFLLMLDITGAELDDGPPNWPGVLGNQWSVSLRVTRDDELSLMIVDEDGSVPWLPTGTAPQSLVGGAPDELAIAPVDEDGDARATIPVPLFAAVGTPNADELSATIVDEDGPRAASLDAGTSPVSPRSVDDDLPTAAATYADEDVASPAAPPAAVLPWVPSGSEELPIPAAEDPGWTFAVAWMPPTTPMRAPDFDDLPGFAPPPPPPGFDEDQPASMLPYAAPGLVTPTATVEEIASSDTLPPYRAVHVRIVNARGTTVVVLAPEVISG
jgi:uncharacterized protein DUF4038/collagenase-like protein with putative collagen-binding domain